MKKIFVKYFLLLYALITTILCIVYKIKYTNVASYSDSIYKAKSFYSDIIKKGNIYINYDNLIFYMYYNKYPEKINFDVSVKHKVDYWENGFKSKYFKIPDKISCEFNKFIREYGYKPYFLYKILNDKTAGSNIEKIEEKLILIEEKYGIDIEFELTYAYESLERKGNYVYILDKVLNNVNKDNEGVITLSKLSEDKKLVDKYLKHELKNRDRFFTKNRKFIEINWEEYFTFIGVKPVLSIQLYVKPENRQKGDRKYNEELRKKLRLDIREIFKSYHNPNTYWIYIDEIK